MGAPEPPHYRRFVDFYPFYLSEHRHRISRRLHVLGTALVIVTTILVLVSGKYSLFWLVPVVGYGFAWVGHFFFEKNRPATFKYPLWSFMGDYKMIALMLTGRMDAEVKKLAR